MEKVLVTGGAGFIGFHTCLKFLKNGYSVVAIDNINDYYSVDLKLKRVEQLGIDKNQVEYNKIVKSKIYDNFDFIKLDLKDRDNIENLFKNFKFDKVCNLAAQAGVRYSLKNPYAYIDSNIVGFLNLLEESKKQKVKHFVYASSSSVYGANESLPFSTKDNIDHPISLYAATKKSNELIAHSYSHLFKIPTTGLRFFTVYGPWGRPDMALFLFTKAILEDKPINIFNYGDMVRDFTYVDDIVEGIFRVIKNPPKGDINWDGKKPDPSCSKAPYKVYNIGNNNPIKLINFIEAIENKLNKKSKKNMLPLQAGDVVATYADVDDLVKNFDYKPKTTIKEGIDKFIDWYQEYSKYI